MYGNRLFMKTDPISIRSDPIFFWPNRFDPNTIQKKFEATNLNQKKIWGDRSDRKKVVGDRSDPDPIQNKFKATNPI